MNDLKRHRRQSGIRKLVCGLLFCALALTSGPIPAWAALCSARSARAVFFGLPHWIDRTRTLPAGQFESTFYDANGNVSSAIDFNGHTTTYQYSYGLLANGQRRTVQEGTGRACLYAYDNLWRLTGETITADPHGKNGIAAYTYDAVGNRQTRTSTVAALPAQTFGYDADDRVQGDTYDANGNTKSGPVSQPASVLAAEPSTTGAQPVSGTDTYDSQNRLIARNGGGSVQVMYDGDGNKVQESVTQNGLTTVTTYLVDSLNPTGYAQVLEEKTNGTLTRVYTWGHELISQDQFAGGSWQLSYYGYDGHGNVRFLSDATGNITDAYDFDAFGNLLNISTGTVPGGGAALPTVNLHLYCGEQFDAGLGMYYLRARLMNPLTGRFWSADSYEGTQNDPASLHKYTYANDGPIAYRDPTGRASLAEVAVSAAIGAMVGAVLNVGVTWFLNPNASGTTLWRAAGFGALTGALGGVAFGVRSGSLFIQVLRVIVSSGLTLYSGIEAIHASGEREKLVYAAFALLSAWGTFSSVKPLLPGAPPVLAPLPAGDILEQVYPRRTPWRKGVKEEVYERAQADSRDGVVRDPYTGIEIKYDEYWELGHEPRYKFSTWQRRAWLEGWTREDWNNFLNDPGVYRPETRFTNGGHYAEDPFD